MALLERVADRVNAILLTGCRESVHTSSGEVGSIEKVDWFKGKIMVKVNGDGVKTFPGRKVAVLDVFVA